MKNLSVKVISFLTAILILLSCMPISVFAENASDYIRAADDFSDSEPSSENVNNYPLGDVTLDNKITAADARLILRISSLLVKVDSDIEILADYDENGTVTAADARCVLRLGAKLDPFAPETTEAPTTAAPPTTKAPEPTTAAPKPLTFKDRKFKVETSPLFSTKYAGYAVLYDYDNDKILYGKNMHSRCHPASTTKIITACLGCEYLSPDYILTVGNELGLMEWNTSKAGIYKGQKIRFKEILKCLLVPSGCDAAYTIAVNVARVAAGNQNMSASSALSYFIGMMNSYAKQLGMKDSHFANPDGFPNSNHYVSAYDMAIIAAKACTFDLIMDTVSQPWATAYFYSGGSATYTNSNETINPYSSRYYPYMVGIKTGSHSQAGQCLVTAAKKYIKNTGKTKTFIAVVMNCPNKDARYNDLKSLYDTAFSYFWRQP